MKTSFAEKLAGLFLLHAVLFLAIFLAILAAYVYGIATDWFYLDIKQCVPPLFKWLARISPFSILAMAGLLHYVERN